MELKDVEGKRQIVTILEWCSLQGRYKHEGFWESSAVEYLSLEASNFKNFNLGCEEQSLSEIRS